MKVTREIIESLYRVTHYYRNGLDLDIIFNQGSHSSEKGGWGGIYDLVYYLLEQMYHVYPELGFGVLYLHSDGGMQDYIITYKKDDYWIMVSREKNMAERTNFTSVENFVDWLNGHVEKINPVSISIPLNKVQVDLTDVINSFGAVADFKETFRGIIIEECNRQFDELLLKNKP